MVIGMNNDLLSKALSQNFVLDYERHISFQKVRLFDHAIQFDIPSLLDVDLGLQLYRIQNGVITHWVEREAFSKFNEKAEQFFREESNNGKIKELINYITESLTKLHQFSIMIPEYSTASDEFLLSEYQKFCELERKTSLMNHLLFFNFENAIGKTLKYQLGEKLEDLSLQTEAIPLEEYYLDICNHLLNKISFKELYQKYIHFGMVDVVDQHLSKEKLIQDIEQIKCTSPILVKSKIEKKYLENSIKVNTVFSKVNIDSHFYTLMKYYQTYSNKKEWKNFIRGMSSYKLSKLLSEIAKRNSLTLQELSYLREEEICKIISDKVNSETIKNRKENSLYIIHHNQIEVIEDKELLEQIDSNLSNKEFELKGEIASPGKIKGKACIILSNQDFYKFNGGDIIIAPTTRPDYLPLMQKSLAIVTNEGGMLSHAAILSRELGKPCLTGTRIATTIFKDGDLIEVDADKGIVRKIK
jgi:phosphohistidine swiveling domain-containing protein